MVPRPTRGGRKGAQTDRRANSDTSEGLGYVAIVQQQIRQLATYAGVTPYDNLQPLRDIVDAWARDVMSSIATEFNLSLD